MIRVLFVCYGSILKSPGKVSKINAFARQKGAYYTTTLFFKGLTIKMVTQQFEQCIRHQNYDTLLTL